MHTFNQGWNLGRDPTGRDASRCPVPGTGRDWDPYFRKSPGRDGTGIEFWKIERDGTGTETLGTAGRARPVASRIIFILFFCLKFFDRIFYRTILCQTKMLR